MDLVVVLATFSAVAVIAYAVAQQTMERRAVHASLGAIDDAVITRSRDRRLVGPVGERIAGPLLHHLVDLGRRWTPHGYITLVRRKLAIAGRARPADVDRFLLIRVLTVAAVPVAALVAVGALGIRGIGLIGVGLVVVALLIAPDAVLNHRMANRQLRIRRQLPDLLDLLTISVEAGLGFEQALERTIQGMPGDLSDEFTRMLGEIRAGSDRALALRSTDDRTDVPEVRSFVLAILQADTFGVSIGRVLRSQAKEMRIRRRQLAQEAAQKAPVKMLLPMVFCIFPALFVVVLGPAVINILHGFNHTFVP